MPSYHFPIVLGQNKKERIVIVHLTDGNEDYQENRVVVVSSSQNEPLFRIPKEAKMVCSDGGISNIVVTTRGNLTIKDGSTDRKIAPHEKDEYYAYSIKNNVEYGFDGIINFRYKINNTEYKGCLNIIRTEDGNVLKINIDLGSEATQATCFCNHLASGSCQPINLIDAIKMTYPEREYDSLKKPTVGKLFIQEDENAHYYKTGNITFHKFSKSSYGNLDLNEKFETNTSETQDQCTVNPFINYLNISATGKNANEGRDKVWEPENPYIEKIPNIKVLYRYLDQVNLLCDIQSKWKNSSGVECGLDNTANIIDVLRVIYKQIITATEKGLKQFNSYDPQKIKATSVLILVPNIYQQKHIDKLLYDLNMLNKTAKMKYDFRVISESDAAFLGVKELVIKDNNTILQIITQGIDDDRQKDAFLIIDSGKGTTDFSIINYNPADPNSSIASYKRGGIAGAGAAIDYVFARIIARQIYKNITNHNQCDETLFVKRFMEMICRLVPMYQDKVTHLIELAKKKYKVEEGEIPNICNVVKGTEQSTEEKVEAYGAFPVQIVEQILDKDKSYDEILELTEWRKVEKYDWDQNSYIKLDDIDKKEIESVCYMIAEGTIKEIFDDENITNRIDFVLMTGRSFFFKPLYSAFEKMLNEKKGVFYENYSNWFKYYFHKKSNNEKHKNLKIDGTTLNLDMKVVSVKFSERDLGYNCNSDLCCLKSLILLNDDKKFDLKQENFWNGFTGFEKNQVYYIGYKNNSFIGQKENDDNGQGIPDLVKMTLFPYAYIEVNLQKQN